MFLICIQNITLSFISYYIANSALRLLVRMSSIISCIKREIFLFFPHNIFAWSFCQNMIDLAFSAKTFTVVFFISQLNFDFRFLSLVKKGNNCRHLFHLEENKCHPSPCKNSGICTETEDGFDCSCKEGYKGKLCEGISFWSKLFNDLQTDYSDWELFR